MITRCWTFAKQRVDFVLAILIGLVFVYISLESFWTDSEMWAAVAAKYMFHNETAVYYNYSIKPIFNFL